MFAIIGVVVMILAVSICPARVVIDETAATARDERQIHAAWVSFKPGNGQVCEVNPPRFSWPYDPAVIVEPDYDKKHLYTLQISRRADMSKIIFERKDTPYNFYNAIPVLQGGPHWFWRVGYDVGTEDEQWSRVRVFSIYDGAEWDRTIIEDIADRISGHPRIGFRAGQMDELRALRESNEESARLYDGCIAAADEILENPDFNNPPESDPLQDETRYKWDCTGFRDLGSQMQTVAMAYVLTGDEKYLAVKKPLLTVAAYPPGGASSPEGLGQNRKWATELTMHMGLCFDWLYDRLSQDERDLLLESLRWRIEYILNDFSWYKNGKPFWRGLGMFVGSHQYQNHQWTFVGALAACEHLDVAREFVQMALHYLVGVTNGMGEVEAWNEGVSYGNGKSRTLIYETLWAAMTVPELQLHKHPFFPRVGEFFSYLTPLGIERSAWGNYGTSANAHIGQHLLNFRRLAYLTGRGSFLKNWQSCVEYRGSKPSNWQEYFLPYHFDRPEPVLEEKNQMLFNHAGWAMAFSGPPSSLDTYEEGVGMVFHCRPRGGYSHSFNNENAFEAFAYGAVIATGGGRKANGDRHADATMSHNSVLVDGIGQDFNQRNPQTERAGRIIAWHEEPGLVYWCGDATPAYAETAPHLERFLRHVLFIDDECFVIVDDLQVADDHDPSRFSWLYHAHQDVPVEIDEENASFSFTVEDTDVTVRHVLNGGDLQIMNLRGEDGYKNPITGTDMLAAAKGSVERSPLRKFRGEPVYNNLWVNSPPAHQWQFLSAILPSRAEEEGPSVRRINDRTIELQTSSGTKRICFGDPGDANVDIVVDYERIRKLAGEPQPPQGRETIWQADLTDTGDWVWDGEGEVEHRDDGVLNVHTTGRTVYWAPVMLDEPVVIDFEAKTDNPRTRAILFFMAEGLNGEDIFTWKRTG
ncbi:MAG: DUF4962 domain-containing protein, partial [Armatimonadota bacterium]